MALMVIIYYGADRNQFDTFATMSPQSFQLGMLYLFIDFVLEGIVLFITQLELKRRFNLHLLPFTLSILSRYWDIFVGVRLLLFAFYVDFLSPHMGIDWTFTFPWLNGLQWRSGLCWRGHEYLWLNGKCDESWTRQKWSDGFTKLVEIDR